MTPAQHNAAHYREEAERLRRMREATTAFRVNALGLANTIVYFATFADGTYARLGTREIPRAVRLEGTIVHVHGVRSWL